LSQWLVDMEYVHPYTLLETAGPSPDQGNAMNQTKVGNRYVVIAGTAQVKKHSRYREATRLPPAADRIVVIKNGEVVAGGRGR
jgi:hypothetical protein